MKVYTPHGAVGSPPAALAPPLGVLANKRIGILDNTKPNAGLLLGRMAEQLSSRTGATVSLIERKNAALPARDETMARLAKEVEAVLTGSAD